MNQVLQRELTQGQYRDGSRELVEALYELGQDHLFDYWAPEGQLRDKKEDFISSLHSVDENYPGGLKAYIENARQLLQDSMAGANPFEGYTPEPPETIDVSEIGEDLFDYESKGVFAIDKLAIAMVAGGLGERLGYDGIKINIPFELAAKTSYLEYYCKNILAMQNIFAEKTGSFTEIPFIIMVSEDTQRLTKEALRKNQFFSLNPSQVTLLKQELVPALNDNHARLALDSEYKLLLKPHGHGDIHLLMFQSGLYNTLFENGKRYLALIQDTNAQVMNAILPAMAVSEAHNLHFNSITVPRVAGEAVGAVAKLRSNQEDKSTITVNVEYNQLDPLLKATVNEGGDIGDENGYSPFPGNINAIIIELGSYREVLTKSGGQIPEFVNPKYADADRTIFKKPTRLETMMQDLPKVFDENKRVGVAMFNRQWVFSPDKNNLADAAGKFQNDQPPECAATAESDFYKIVRQKVKSSGNTVSEDQEPTMYAGVPYLAGSRFVLDPAFSLTLEILKERMVNCSFSRDSVLIVEGAGLKLRNVNLLNKAAVHVELDEDCQLLIEDMSFDQGEGLEIVPLTDQELESNSVEQFLRIRGYRFDLNRLIHIRVKKPGKYKLRDDLSLQRLY